MKMILPQFVNKAMDILNRSGHESFVVGGCVRDILMGRTPEDWDICTSAKPEETLKAFEGFRTVTIGIQHGTVAVVIDEHLLEVTTYRLDGAYLDSRHPESVEFTAKIEDDLARRDFTMNAIAYNPQRGLIDPFGGQDAIKGGIIQCVGEAPKRFEEDALRILRGIRFASVLGFDIEETTCAAMFDCRERIRNIFPERINVEISKLIMGEYADQILREFFEILKIAAPGMVLTAVAGLSEQLPICPAGSPEQLPIRLAALFPEETEAALRNLKYDHDTAETAAALAALYKEKPPEGPVEIKKMLRDHGEKITALYFAAKGRGALLKDVLSSGECYSMAQLNINGNALIAAGFTPGPQIGRILNDLLNRVIEGSLENDTEFLIASAVALRTAAGLGK